jgi:hypothetical protein
MTTGPSLRRVRGSILGPERPASTAAAAAAVARTGSRETRRGPVWPRRPTDAAVQRARARIHSHVPLPRVAVGRPRCVGPAVGTSGGGGLARRATTASAAVAVLVVVAVAITAIVVFVVVLVLVATGTAVSAIERARRHGRWWLGRRGHNVGVECRQGSRRTGTVHVNLLQ